MNYLSASIAITFMSAVAMLFTGNVVFLLPLVIAGGLSGWFGMESRYGTAEVN